MVVLPTTVVLLIRSLELPVLEPPLRTLKLALLVETEDPLVMFAPIFNTKLELLVLVLLQQTHKPVHLVYTS